MTYLRLVFTVYWENMSPSTEPMYLQTPAPTTLTIPEITSAQDQTLAMMKAHAEAGAVPLEAIFIGDREVDMTTDEIETAGWRIMATAAA